jgi:tRNA dimethylallyltransferase
VGTPEAQPPVVAIFGPTGIGKTSIAIGLAELLRQDGEDPVAVSVDSMQVYSELPLLTGAATAREQSQLEHRLVGTTSVTESWDVATHADLAHAAIDELRGAGRRPIVVGGTGLYLRAALTELDLLPPAQPEVRARLENDLAMWGQAGLYGRLVATDPEVAGSIDPADSRRTLRALEAHEQGRSASDREVNRLWTDDVRVPTRLFALTMKRDLLYERIEQRVESMVAAGAEDEVEAAEELGASRTARQALGYRELLSGDVEAMKVNTRRYAKRQLTWLRKLAGADLLDVTNRTADEVAADIAGRLRTG